MWKTGTPAGTEVSSQECKVQRLPQNWTFPQGMPVQEKRANFVQTLQDDDDPNINENGVRQPNLPRVNMLKLVNHLEADKGGKHLKFPIARYPKGPYKHHIVVRVDTGTDVSCMNEKTFNELFPEVQLSVCPQEIQNFGNLVADISIPGQFCTYLEFRGEKYYPEDNIKLPIIAVNMITTRILMSTDYQGSFSNKLE